MYIKYILYVRNCDTVLHILYMFKRDRLKTKCIAWEGATGQLHVCKSSLRSINKALAKGCERFLLNGEYSRSPR